VTKQVCVFTLLSAIANQLLLQAKLKRGFSKGRGGWLGGHGPVYFIHHCPTDRNRYQPIGMIQTGEASLFEATPPRYSKRFAMFRFQCFQIFQVMTVKMSAFSVSSAS
jgi:hypothetical protein